MGNRGFWQCNGLAAAGRFEFLNSRNGTPVRAASMQRPAAAKMAADRGVRVHVIGLGTVEGDAAAPDGMAIYMKLDEPTLREGARMTGGDYHDAGTAKELRSVYENFGLRVRVLTRKTELSAMFALVSALSMLWFGRIA